jgi:hypothetical protein
MPPFDAEIADSSWLESELPRQPAEAAVTVAAAYKRGPERLTYKGTQYIWKHHHNNNGRASTMTSVLWQLRDEYKRIGSDQRTKKYWRYGLYKKTILLEVNTSLNAGVRYLKRKHKID